MIRKACLPPQIGNRFAITAAHCLLDDDNEEVLPANMFSVMLGVHNRRVTRAPNRYLRLREFPICCNLPLVPRCLFVNHVQITNKGINTESLKLPKGYE